MRKPSRVWKESCHEFQRHLITPQYQTRIDSFEKLTIERSSESLLSSLRDAKMERADCRLCLQRLKQSRTQQLPNLPQADEWKTLAREAFQDIDTSSPAFARLMRALIPEIHVYPFRLIDGGLPVLRVCLTLKPCKSSWGKIPARPRISSNEISFPRRTFSGQS